ncbi:uncharacterized protein LOC141712750 [Apium graveolens]|uniref:uncharacterized protein LOC141712750 n=1 Tax=Apium graveolens TaxID=4045 RepID=UPI003D7A3320
MHTARQIWEDLAIRYSQNNVPRLFNIRKELASLTQGTQSITSYFTYFRGLMDELENLAPIPRCSCSTPTTTCTCDLTVKIVNYEKQMKLSQFLMGLNEQFTATRGQILLMSPLPDLNQAYAMLLQDENQRSHVQPISLMPEHSAMNARFIHNNNQRKSGSFRRDDRRNPDTAIECEYCHLSGHNRDKCFALHGYPEWHRLHGKPKPKIRASSTKQSAATVIIESPKTDMVPSSTNVSDELSESQCHQLIQMLQSKMKASHSVPSSSAPWLHNSTNHVAGPCIDDGDRDW